MYAYEAPTSDPRDVKAMKLANPASWITLDYLRRQAENPELTDAQVLQLHGCVWAATSSTWIPPRHGLRGNFDRKMEPGEQGVLAFDGSKRRSTVSSRPPCTGGDGAVRRRGRAAGARVAGATRAGARGGVKEALEVTVESPVDPFGWGVRARRVAGAVRRVVVDHIRRTRRRGWGRPEPVPVGLLEGDLSHDGAR